MRLTEAHIALLPVKIDDPGPTPQQGPPPPDAYYTSTASAVITAVPPGEDLWLFAYGSLICNKRFPFVEERSGTIRGWHRDFCLGPDLRCRGNPKAPGYMLSLDRGGACRGMVYRLPKDELLAGVEQVLRGEPPLPVIWATATTTLGPVRAFAFGRPSGRKIPRLSDDTLADALTIAVGKAGNMPTYVFNTARHLEALGLCDDRLWRMQEMIAERIERRFPDRLPG